MEINSLKKILEQKLKGNIKIHKIKIEDKSFLHIKHQNFNKDKFHIKLTIESPELKKRKPIEANKKIFNAINEELKNYIHSLQIVIN